MRFVRIKEVLQMVGVSRTTLWRMVRDGTFPRRVVISSGVRAHVYEEVEAWMRSRIEKVQESEGATPAPRMSPSLEERLLPTTRSRC
jgi:prophage regulatory protein